eukprot:13183107-Alexandrium_andersonii.AAC.1
MDTAKGSALNFLHSSMCGGAARVPNHHAEVLYLRSLWRHHRGRSQLRDPYGEHTAGVPCRM